MEFYGLLRFNEVAALSFDDLVWIFLFDIRRRINMPREILSLLILTLIPFHAQYAKVLTYNSALSDFKKLFKFFDLDPTGFGEHSGRRGGTTAAVAAGAQIELMLQGRWRSESMPPLYTDDAVKLRRDFASRLSN